jgi:hypothetical protein
MAFDKFEEAFTAISKSIEESRKLPGPTEK